MNRKGGRARGLLGCTSAEYNLHLRPANFQGGIPRGLRRSRRPRSRRQQVDDTPTGTMSRVGLHTMETIHEPAHKTLEMPKLLPEAALFSVSKPTRLKTETVVISGAVNDGLFGRSSSMKMPLTRKASFRVREWVKRSSSTRYACPNLPPPSPPAVLYLANMKLTFAPGPQEHQGCRRPTS